MRIVSNMSDLETLLLLAFIGSVAGLIGGLVLIFKRNWAKGLASVSIPLAAGVLLAVSLLDLLPEAVEEVGESAFMVVLVVFVALFLVEKFIFYLHHHHDVDDHDHGDHKSGHPETAVPMVILGDTIHNFLDGVAIAAAYMVDPTLGWIVAFSTFLHETPHEIADFGILLARGWSRQKAIIVNFLSALATFPGALITYYVAGDIEGAVGILLAVAAGLFLYVAATDFLPEVGHASRKGAVKQTAFLLLGVIIIVAVSMLLPEGAH